MHMCIIVGGNVQFTIHNLVLGDDTPNSPSSLIKTTMFDLKVIHAVLGELEEERGIPKEKVIEAIEMALATAYKKEYGKRGQIVRAQFDIQTGFPVFEQVKIVVSKDQLVTEEEFKALKDENNEEALETKIVFDDEKHILIDTAKLIKKDVEVGEEMVFPLENKGDFGRIASQTAKQVIMQKIREAEKTSVLAEFGDREGEIVSGTVQRIERGTIFIDIGRAVGIIPFEEQIRGERYEQGERVRAYLYKVEESQRGAFIKLSRSHPRFIEKLFEAETPEIKNGTVEIKAIAREAGSRTKIAVTTHDPHIDPVGSMVGQRGVRVLTVMSELGGEKIDIVEWSEDPAEYIAEAISPAEAVSVTVFEDEKRAVVEVAEDQQSLAIGRGGQNVRLGAKLTGWKIDIKSIEGENLASADENKVVIEETVAESKDTEAETPEKIEIIEEDIESTDADSTEDAPEKSEEAPIEPTEETKEEK